MTERVVVIGIAPDGRPATPVPVDAALIVGGRRHLDAHAPAGTATLAIEGDLDRALDRIEANDGPVCVLASGDPGWFGILRRLRSRLGPQRLEVHPAASSVAGAFAAVAEPWDDATVVSAHGREARAAVATVLAHPTVAVLTSPEATPATIARQLLACGAGPRRTVVAVRLGHDDQRLHEGDLASVAELDKVGEPNVLLVLDPDRERGDVGPTVVAHARPRTRWGAPAEAFEHRDGQVSKPVVRAVALAALAPGPGRLLWDLGCGSGSVAVEAAGLGAGVVAVDRDPAQVDRTRANATARSVSVGTLTGTAPDVLEALPDPDGVFVGGGGADLPAILEVVASRCRDTIVVALATLERIGPTIAALHTAGWDAQAQLLAVHDLAPLGDGHRLAPHNPVALVTAERP